MGLEISKEEKCLGIKMAIHHFFSSSICIPKERKLLLFAISLRYAARMPLPSGLDSTFYFHNNEFGLAKDVLLELHFFSTNLYENNQKKNTKNINH
jgi:hypothetical protein